MTHFLMVILLPIPKYSLSFCHLFGPLEMSIWNSAAVIDRFCYLISVGYADWAVLNIPTEVVWTVVRVAAKDSCLSLFIDKIFSIWFCQIKYYLLVIGTTNVEDILEIIWSFHVRTAYLLTPLVYLGYPIFPRGTLNSWSLIDYMRYPGASLGYPRYPWWSKLLRIGRVG